jgi:hypothetical protein
MPFGLGDELALNIRLTEFSPSFQLQEKELLALENHFKTPIGISKDTLIVLLRPIKRVERGLTRE